MSLWLVGLWILVSIIVAHGHQMIRHRRSIYVFLDKLRATWQAMRLVPGLLVRLQQLPVECGCKIDHTHVWLVVTLSPIANTCLNN